MTEGCPCWSSAVVTLFPACLDHLRYGVVGQALEQGRVQLDTFNPRDHASNLHGYVDDRPYGGGAGMVLQAPPVLAAIRAAREHLEGGPISPRVVAMGPEGQPLNHRWLARHAHRRTPLIWVCGRYEGIDERVMALEVDETISVGDWVLSGGEIAAMAAIDGLVRLLPGVLGHADSALEDSFAQGGLDHPHYTRPWVVEKVSVPGILRSGDHAAIQAWRRKAALRRTWRYRPDLLRTLPMTNNDWDDLLGSEALND